MIETCQGIGLCQVDYSLCLSLHRISINHTFHVSIGRTIELCVVLICTLLVVGRVIHLILLIVDHLDQWCVGRVVQAFLSKVLVDHLLIVHVSLEVLLLKVLHSGLVYHVLVVALGVDTLMRRVCLFVKVIVISLMRCSDVWQGACVKHYVVLV